MGDASLLQDRRLRAVRALGGAVALLGLVVLGVAGVASATDGDPASADCAYSWDTHNATCVIHLGNADGSGRSGVSISQWMWHVESKTNITPLPSIIEEGTGNYLMSVNLGTSPRLGTYNYTIRAPNTGVLAPVSASAAFSVPDNLTLRLQDLSGLVSSVSSWMNASFAYTNGLVNSTSAYTTSVVNASRALDAGNFSQIDAALANLSASVGNATTGTPPLVNFTVTGDPAPDAGVYVHRAARFTASVTNTSAWGGLLFVWDFGDNTTAQGPVAYHTYTAKRNYTVWLDVYNALGQSASATQVVTVNVSTPTANITGPVTSIALLNATFRGGGSYDNHSTITSYLWEVDAEDVDLGWFGVRHLNKGFWKGENFTFIFVTTGNHTVNLTVTNQAGVSNTTSRVVSVSFPVEPGAPLTPPPNLGKETGDRVKNGLGVIERIFRFIFG